MATWKFSVPLLLLLAFCSGCSTLGLSLYPSGQFLTKEAEEVLGASRVASNLPRELAMAPMPTHLLQPGDVVLVEAIHFESELLLPGDQPILADGTVDLGEFGRVRMVGATLESAEALVEQQIRQHLIRKAELVTLATGQAINPEDEAALKQRINRLAVNVRLVEPIHHFYVLGEVNAPGSFPLKGHETVLDAIVNAGGLTGAADPCKILLARPTGPNHCRIVLPVCYREIVQMGSATSNYQVRPGDRIFVSSRSCCEDLLFWKARKTCDRCCECNRPCAHPAPIATPHSFEGTPTASILPGSLGFDLPADSPAEDDANKDVVKPSDSRLNEASFPEMLEIDPVGSPDNATRKSDAILDGQLRFDE